MTIKRTYQATYNGRTKTITTARDLKHAGIGVFPDGSVFFCWSTLADPIKAARSTNPYATTYTAVPVEVVA